MNANATDAMLNLQSFLDQSPKSIELLPEASFPGPSAVQILFLEANLGISTKLIYGSYVEACHNLSRLVPRASGEVAPLIASTSVILLANPAHQTNLNVRKRLMEAGKLDMRQELALLAALMPCSKEAAKQATLWSHRRWILQQLYPASTASATTFSSNSTHSSEGPPTFHPSSIPSAIIHQELHLVFRTCDLFSRNYYAWTHAQFCIESLAGPLDPLSSPELHPTDDALDIVCLHVRETRSWIERHVTDYSAAHHLCTISRTFCGTTLLLGSTKPEEIQQLLSPKSLFDHSFALLRTYGSHEALRMYLRMAVMLESNPVARTVLMKEASALPCQDVAASGSWWQIQLALDKGEELKEEQVRNMFTNMRM